MSEEVRKTIPELVSGSTVSGSLFETAYPNVSESSGYSSVKVSSDDVASYIATTQRFPTLTTTAKTLVSAINEAATTGGGGSSNVKILSNTLTAGSTTITFNDSAITATSFISVASEAWYTTTPTQTTGSVTLTFPAQSTDMLVQIMVAN